MEIVQRMDAWGKPAWITAMVVGFIVFWPIGLALLAFLIWSGRMGCSNKFGWGRKARRAAQFTSSSGNSAFDEYRDATLKRLEDEQREFGDFLDQLRRAKDKAEFDQFMADRKNRPAKPKSDEADNNGSVPDAGGLHGGPEPSPAY